MPVAAMWRREGRTWQGTGPCTVAALGGLVFLISVRLLFLLHPNSRGVEILHILPSQVALPSP